MSDNDTTRPSPIDDIRARLVEDSPLPWTEYDIRTLLDQLDHALAMTSRVCTAMANSQQVAQTIMDSRNALARKVSGLRDLANSIEAHSELEGEPAQYRDALTGSWIDVADAIRELTGDPDSDEL
ncbi:hypothetical protein [Ornithinimicrobium murale]|uniref:hypothetical protein n=1 Tax=Ornithinimicrobium murale TaxID=1050153 RepID=UPI000E0D34FC|nr:hypothetical protein [Ornithinimicrobium murale]